MQHTDIGFKSQHALGHIAAVNAEVAQYRAQFARVGFGFYGAADIRFGYDFQERNASAIVIDQAAAHDVRELAGVFFHVGAANADALA